MIIDNRAGRVPFLALDDVNLASFPAFSFFHGDFIFACYLAIFKSYKSRAVARAISRKINAGNCVRKSVKIVMGCSNATTSSSNVLYFLWS